MKSQLWKGFTGSGSRVQVGKQRLFVVPLSKTRVFPEFFPESGLNVDGSGLNGSDTGFQGLKTHRTR